MCMNRDIVGAILDRVLHHGSVAAVGPQSPCLHVNAVTLMQQC